MKGFRASIVGITAGALVSGIALGAEPCKNADANVGRSAQATAEMGLKLSTALLRKTPMEKATKDLLKRWFGDDSEGTRAKVLGILDQTHDWVSKTTAFWCEYSNTGQHVTPPAPGGGYVGVDEAGTIFAYVYPGDPGRIYLGLAFFNAPDIGVDSKYGTIVHEMTHYFLNGNTGDFDIYGKAKSLQLAKDDPAKAQKHADSYQYFVEEAAPP